MNRILLFALMLFLWSSCSYEEGPWISFKSKEERMANQWFVPLAIDDSEEEITPEFNRQLFLFTKDGNVKIYFYKKNEDPDSIAGTWFFSDKKKTFNWDLQADEQKLQELEFYYPAQQAFEILRLYEDECWLKDEAGGRLFLEPK